MDNLPLDDVSLMKRFAGALGMHLLWVFCALFVLTPILTPFGIVLPGPIASPGYIAWWYIAERIIAWGLLPILLSYLMGPRLQPLPAIIAVTALDCLAFAFAPAHSMHGRSPAEFFGFQATAWALVVFPAALFFQWTFLRKRLFGRLTLHFFYYAVLLLLVIPSLIFAFTGETASAYQHRSGRLNRILLQMIFPAGILGWTAARELALRGGGSPMPWDPPRKLVTTGPYAFVSDPLRLAKTMLLLTWALFLGNVWLGVAALLIPLYGLTVARLLENRDLEKRHGDAWLRYRANVRPWWPRWSPWRDPALPVALLRIDSECGACNALGRWFQGNPGLSIACIRQAPHGPLPERPVYEPGDGGPSEEGIGALGRALEHRNFAFAFIGWCMRMPVVRPVLQLIFDAVTEKDSRHASSRLLDAEESRGENVPS